MALLPLAEALQQMLQQLPLPKVTETLALNQTVFWRKIFSRQSMFQVLIILLWMAMRFV